MAEVKEIQVDRALPTPEAMEALNAALRNELGTKCAGATGASDRKLRILLALDATAEDENTATQIVLRHDFAERTPRQIEQAERREKLLALRAEMNPPGIKASSKADTKPPTVEALQRRIDWLTMEIENLLERTGDA